MSKVLNKNKIKIKLEDMEDIEDEKCPICLDEVDIIKNLVTFECGHSLHFSCYAEYMASTEASNHKCMLCRKEIYSSEVKRKLVNNTRSNLPRIEVVNDDDPMNFVLRALGVNLPEAPRNVRMRTDEYIGGIIREILLLSSDALSLREIYVLVLEREFVSISRIRRLVGRLYERGILDRFRHGNAYKYLVTRV